MIQKPAQRATLSVLVITLCLAPAARAADARPDERTLAVKAAVAERMPHHFSEVTKNPELRRIWWNMIWTAWPEDLVQPDFSDFDKTKWFDAPPKPYVHPRVYLRPELLPALRERLQRTKSGQVAWKRYQAECQRLYEDPSLRAIFDGFLTGKYGADFETVYAEKGCEFAQRLMWESLRILIADDKQAAEPFGKVMAAYATRLQGVYDEKQVGTKNYIFQPVAIWGTTHPGEKITLTFRNQKKEAVADATGAWRMKLDPLTAGGTDEFIVTGTNTITLKDVLVGEVWLGAGPSNMGLPCSFSVKDDLVLAERVARGPYPEILLLAGSGKGWRQGYPACSPISVMAMSNGTAWIFGRRNQTVHFACKLLKKE